MRVRPTTLNFLLHGRAPASLGRRGVTGDCHRGGPGGQRSRRPGQLACSRLFDARGFGGQGCEPRTYGGAGAQAWLYPLLTDTRTESGVPAGVGGGTVVHKTGTIDLVVNDAALVTSGPDGPYVLVVMTDGFGGTPGWQVIASISADVWQLEAARPQ
jgi:hypothetical protein